MNYLASSFIEQQKLQKNKFYLWKKMIWFIDGNPFLSWGLIGSWRRHLDGNVINVEMKTLNVQMQTLNVLMKILNFLMKNLNFEM